MAFKEIETRLLMFQIMHVEYTLTTANLITVRLQEFVTVFKIIVTSSFVLYRTTKNCRLQYENCVCFMK